MNGQLRARLQAIRASYWFIPSLMAGGAILLSIVMIWLDVRLGTSWMDGLGWYQQVRVDGAREVLSTIAGSMITVAGVVFSITIVALSYASSQYGPRVLTNFMSDRGNTVTLGTFVATFVYGLMVLRTIRGGDEGSFVPQLAVMVGMGLALCSIGVLIYFIHHVPQTIHINHVVARIGRKLIEETKERFPSPIGAPVSENSKPPIEPALDLEAGDVEATTTGYLQSIDEDALLEAATDADVLVRLRYGPGEFIVAGRSIAEVWPAECLNKDIARNIRNAFTTGSKRTPEGDIMFLVSELVEIAARALSPGVNDPMTAITCLDWLGAGASEFSCRQMPPSLRVDDHNKLRIIAPSDSFYTFNENSFGALRRYVASDMIVSVHFLKVLGEIARTAPAATQVGILRMEADRLVEAADQNLTGADLAAVRNGYQSLLKILDKAAERTAKLAPIAA